MTLTATYFDPLSSQLVATCDDAAPMSLGKVADPHLREMFILDPRTVCRAAVDQPGMIEAIAGHCGLPRAEVEIMVKHLVEEMELEEQNDDEVGR